MTVGEGVDIEVACGALGNSLTVPVPFTVEYIVLFHVLHSFELILICTVSFYNLNNLYFYFMYIDVLPASMSVHRVHTLPMEARRGCCIPLVRVLVVLPGDLGSIANTYMVVHNHFFKCAYNSL